MADSDDIIDAVGADAEIGVQRASIAGESVDMMSVEDRLKAAEAVAQTTAATKPQFGIRFSQIIPPGCG